MNYSREGRIQSGKRETGKDGKLLDSTNSRDLSGSCVVPQSGRTSGGCFCVTKCAALRAEGGLFFVAESGQ